MRCGGTVVLKGAFFGPIFGPAFLAHGPNWLYSIAIGHYQSDLARTGTLKNPSFKVGGGGVCGVAYSFKCGCCG